VVVFVVTVAGDAAVGVATVGPVGAWIVTVAVPETDPLVAVTVVVAAAAGAVNRPAELIVPPPLADQVKEG
jgi:hypothetical protein